MDLSYNHLRDRLSEKGLKVTPQRIAILEAIYKLEDHPTAENIIQYIRKNHPNIATGTVYNVLDTLIANQIIKKVTTDKGFMRYDGIMESHHHLYCSACETIKDYVDPELDRLLDNYFRDKQIDDFEIDEIVVQIKGKFDHCMDKK
jgi:Fur family transcriptional regulator, peroxide stress response regulator